jgi:AraC-like DNA-binding protein
MVNIAYFLRILSFSVAHGMSILDQSISITDFFPTMPLLSDNIASKPDFFSSQVSEARRFFLNLNPDPKLGLVVVCGGVEHCAPVYTINRTSFQFHSIEFVARGLGWLKLRQKKHQLQPGSVFSYGPGVPHEIATDPEQPMVKYFVDFCGTDATELLARCRLSPGTMSQVFPPLELQPLFDELIRNGLRGTRRAPSVCVKLLEALSLKTVESRAPLSGRETLAFGTYQRCRDYIGRHFNQLRSVAQIAAECHLDDTYLCRLFKQYDHETPYRFLLRLKMNYAAERLQSPSMLVKHIAEETGFVNQFHFSRVFKSVFGVSPSALSKLR